MPAFGDSFSEQLQQQLFRVGESFMLCRFLGILFMIKSFFWYDLETTGLNPSADAIIQFGGVRTDLNLKQIEEPILINVRCPEDILPTPESCLITSWTPVQTRDDALLEQEFFAVINAEFSTPGTCVVGYNNLAFDDEFIRHGLFRNFFASFQGSWNSSRWDICELIRTYAALYPQSLEWPYREHKKNRPKAKSFKLQDLAKVNKIKHKAHSALSDTMATLDLARLMRSAQSELFDYALTHRHRSQALEILGDSLSGAVLYVSYIFPSIHNKMRPVALLTMNPLDENKAILVDLMASLQWLQADDEKIQAVVTYNKSLQKRNNMDIHVPLYQIDLQHCPLLLAMDMFAEGGAGEELLDKQLIATNLNLYRNVKDLQKRVADIYKNNVEEGSYGAVYTAADAADQDIYLDSKDQHGYHQIRDEQGLYHVHLKPEFHDKRLAQIFVQYRARNHPESLSDEELASWHKDVWARFEGASGHNRRDGSAYSNIEDNLNKIDKLMAKIISKRKRLLLLKLKNYIIDIQAKFKPSSTQTEDE